MASTEVRIPIVALRRIIYNSLDAIFRDTEIYEAVYANIMSQIEDDIYDQGYEVKDEVRWIPVSERLPKETGLYLISLNTKGVGLFEETHPDGFVYVSAYDAVIMHWGYGDKNVQAWMPLPKPYRREK